MFFLRPMPPRWCVEMAKYPYNTKTWKALISGNTTEVLNTHLAEAFGDLSDANLKAGDFSNALEAAELGIKFGPELLWIRVNRAHALMFLDRTAEATEEY